MLRSPLRTVSVSPLCRPATTSEKSAAARPSDGLIRRVADRIERAFGAARITGHAQISAVMNHLVRKENPPVLRDDAHEIFLDLYRVGLLRQVETAGDTLNMGVDDDS